MAMEVLAAVGSYYDDIGPTETVSILSSHETSPIKVEMDTAVPPPQTAILADVMLIDVLLVLSVAAVAYVEYVSGSVHPPSDVTISMQVGARVRARVGMFVVVVIYWLASTWPSTDWSVLLDLLCFIGTMFTLVHALNWYKYTRADPVDADAVTGGDLDDDPTELSDDDVM